MEKEKFTPGEVAKFHGTTRGAIYTAIRSGRLKASFDSGEWIITREDYQHYVRNKYSRKYTKINGEWLFDKEKGEYSVNEASKLLKVNANQVYYFCRNKTLPSTRKGYAYVIQLKDIEDLKKNRARFR